MSSSLAVASLVTMTQGFIVPVRTGAAVATIAPLSASLIACRTGSLRCDEVSDWGVENLFEMMEDADEKIGGLDAFLKTIKSDPKSIDFEQTMAAIEDGYEYTPVAFMCGELTSAADQNQGSAKIFSFAKLQKLKKDDTLELFGRFYRDDVLNHPEGADHGNIRNFMASGWDGVSFPDGLALKAKTVE